MSKIATWNTPMGTEERKTNDFRYVIRNGNKILQQKVCILEVNIGGAIIGTKAEEWRAVEVINEDEGKVMTMD